MYINHLPADSFRRDYSSAAHPILIGGCGRSGTTLLRVMFDSHRQIVCGPESWLFVSPRVDVVGIAEKFDLDVQDVLDLYVTCRSRAEFIDGFFARVARRADKSRWAEKTPKNVVKLEHLFSCFPKARFVHVIRDGRDVVCSLRTHPRHRVVEGSLLPVETRHPLAACIARWLEDVRAGLAYRGDPRYCEVRYEDLVRSPQPVLECLCRFVDEPMDAAMLEFHTIKTSSRDERKFPQNPEATRPLYTDAVGRWQTDLTSAEIDLFKRLAGPLLMHLGYESSSAW